MSEEAKEGQREPDTAKKVKGTPRGRQKKQGENRKREEAKNKKN